MIYERVSVVEMPKAAEAFLLRGAEASMQPPCRDASVQDALDRLRHLCENSTQFHNKTAAGNRPDVEF